MLFIDIRFKEDLEYLFIYLLREVICGVDFKRVLEKD